MGNFKEYAITQSLLEEFSTKAMSFSCSRKDFSQLSITRQFINVNKAVFTINAKILKEASNYKIDAVLQQNFKEIWVWLLMQDNLM